mmetsp:Transcript_3801/g.12311  ORF Transcript_3801/g.12311 Transcript_3801/m.12311 type:complete len:209 (-) Transcript_3801:519-1145(-)
MLGRGHRPLLGALQGRARPGRAAAAPRGRNTQRWLPERHRPALPFRAAHGAVRGHEAAAGGVAEGMEPQCHALPQAEQEGRPCRRRQRPLPEGAAGRQPRRRVEGASEGHEQGAAARKGGERPRVRGGGGVRAERGGRRGPYEVHHDLPALPRRAEHQLVAEGREPGCGAAVCGDGVEGLARALEGEHARSRPGHALPLEESGSARWC